MCWIRNDLKVLVIMFGSFELFVISWYFDVFVNFGIFIIRSFGNCW